jgi:hypothetical protein
MRSANRHCQQRQVRAINGTRRIFANAKQKQRKKLSAAYRPDPEGFNRTSLLVRQNTGSAIKNSMAPSSATTGALFSPSSLNLPARPSTRDRERGRDRERLDPQQQPQQQQQQQTSLSAVRTSSKERKASFSSLKASLPGSRRRANAAATASSNSGAITDASAPPALPDYALAAAAKIVAKDGSNKDKDKDKGKDKDKDKDRRDAIEGPWATDPATMIPRAATMTTMTPATPVEVRPGMSSTMWALAQGESHLLHLQVTETAQKRVSTLDYLRKA